MASINQAILKTLLYADVFNFPLTKDELWTYLVHDTAISQDEFDNSIKRLGEKIKHVGRYFFITSSQKKLIDREKRKEISQKKMRLARQLAYYLSFIPTINFIGVSGAVAIENAGEADDIDFFLICRKNTLWVSRLCALSILHLLGRRRSRGMSQAKDMICLNMLLADSAITFLGEKHSLYLAHEIVQIAPLFSRNSMYQKFLAANSWVDRYLPHAIAYTKNKEIPFERKSTDSFLLSLLTRRIVLQLSKFFQKVYMRHAKRSETIEDSLLAFHPFDYAVVIMDEYRKRLARFELKE